MQKKGREKRCNKNRRGHTSIYHCFAFFSFNFENVTMKKALLLHMLFPTFAWTAYEANKTDASGGQ